MALSALELLFANRSSSVDYFSSGFITYSPASFLVMGCNTARHAFSSSALTNAFIRAFQSEKLQPSRIGARETEPPSFRKSIPVTVDQLPKSHQANGSKPRIIWWELKAAVPLSTTCAHLFHFFSIYIVPIYFYGDAWDDGSYTGIREIELFHGDTIEAIFLVYDLNGQPFPVSEHPGNKPSGKKEKIVLQFPEEFLVSVSGHTGVLPPVVPGKDDVIRSLTFRTNKKIYGPYGVEEGTHFSLPIETGLIVGFKGRSGIALNAIGFHLSL
ncbi:hypothetical protein L484_023728 [Morus notabilis]|uniref:Jacalin-type lectin domain-containing protein n=1 Tax=Morus notabilis TaxID=981085 RepID=W9QR25_9ROSA|nr:hypothetical protein L484_023728 [Morus notabilis]